MNRKKRSAVSAFSIRVLFKFRILMLYDHDVIELQQKLNISSTRFPGLPTLVTEHASHMVLWDVQFNT